MKMQKLFILPKKTFTIFGPSFHPRSFSGSRTGVQPAHDSIGHGQDEGVRGRPRDAHGPHVQVSKLTIYSRNLQL
jgi:hypothetical protein